MRTAIAGLALIGAVALAQGAGAQTANTPATTPGMTGPVPGSAAPGAPNAPAVGGVPATRMGTGLGTGTATGTSTNTGVGVIDRNTGRAAAGGNSNQAVATTAANAAQPAHGSNSFTAGEAQRRIASNGYQNVSGLTKDNNGVWRGTAMKNGASVQVWLDYKGNVGQQ